MPAKSLGEPRYSETAQQDVLDLEIVLDPILGTFAADSRFLHSAKGSDFGRYDAFVNADDSVFKGFGHAQYTADIPRVEISRKAIGRIIRKTDRLGFVFEAEERCDRSEDFLPCNFHRGRNLRHNGWLEERAAQSVAMSAG